MVRIADALAVAQMMTSAPVWLGTLAATGFAWVAHDGSMTCSSEDVLQAVKVIARHRIEQIAGDDERSPFERPDPFVTDSIRAGSVTWKLGSIRDRGAEAPDDVPRCAAVLTVKGERDSRAHFNVDYTVRGRKGDMLVTVTTDNMRPQ
jgi:hypothetical protein